MFSYLGGSQLLPLFIWEYLSPGDELQLCRLGPIELLPHFQPDLGGEGAAAWRPGMTVCVWRIAGSSGWTRGCEGVYRGVGGGICEGVGCIYMRRLCGSVCV